MFPFDDVIMITVITITIYVLYILYDYLTWTEKKVVFVLVGASEVILKNMGN